MASRWVRLAGLSWAVVPLAIGCGSDRSTDVDDDGDDDDVLPPALITDLRAVDSTRSTITLAWTVPESDATHGAAAWYDLRKSLAPLTAATWDGATQITEVPPARPGGQTETVLVAGLSSGTRHYFGLKCCTHEGSWSELSNLVEASTVADMVVVFHDPNLEAAIREKLAKPDGDLLASDMEAIIDLAADDLGIVDLTGMEHCTRIMFLALRDNGIVDLGPVSGLVTLYDLNLYNNQVSDLAPLEGLRALRHLHLGQNQIADLSPLAALTDLEILTLSDNPATSGLAPIAGLTEIIEISFARTGIADLSPLVAMTKVQVLEASFNGISNISALEHLLELRELWLLQNEIADLGPLVANPGLGTGDRIRLLWNPLSAEAIATQIPALEARGVIVEY